MVGFCDAILWHEVEGKIPSRSHNGELLIASTNRCIRNSIMNLAGGAADGRGFLLHQLPRSKWIRNRYRLDAEIKGRIIPGQECAIIVAGGDYIPRASTLKGKAEDSHLEF